MERVGTEYEVKRLVTFEGEGTLKAICDLEVGGVLLVKGLRVVEGKNGLFASMPRHQGKDQKWYDSVLALTKETKEGISRAVLDAYQQEAVSNNRG
jgi:stage V sporulation protein G